MTEPLWKWDAGALAAAIRAREISAREAVTSCVERMHAVNPRINAVTVDLSQEALALADRADAAVARGDALGTLHGVPVTIKENVDQEGCATVNGVEAYRDAIASADSPVVANWKKAGAIIIGRTNTPAFSFRLDTVNEFRGRTYSPWSRAHTPGGSSGGASASVAAGITPLAHGNDIAGSVRYPAYCTGLAGLRPSFGRVPAYNPLGQGGAHDLGATHVGAGRACPLGARRPARLRGDGAARSARSVVDAGAAFRHGGRPADSRRGRRARRGSRGHCADGTDRGGAEAGGEGARRRGLRDRRREDARLRARVRALVRDADPGVPALHARRLRARRRRRHSHRDALRARQRAREATPNRTCARWPSARASFASGTCSSRARRSC